MKLLLLTFKNLIWVVCLKFDKILVEWVFFAVRHRSANLTKFLLLIETIVVALSYLHRFDSVGDHKDCNRKLLSHLGMSSLKF